METTASAADHFIKSYKHNNPMLNMPYRDELQNGVLLIATLLWPPTYG